MNKYQSLGTYPRLLIFTHESVGDKISGPGVRAWELAKALGGHGVNITLATPFRSNRKTKNVVIENYSWEFPETIKKLIETNDVLLISGPVLARLVMTLKTNIEKPVIVDTYYIPEIEQIILNKYKNLYFDPLPAYLHEMFLYLRQGDLFLYAFERQFDFLLGILLASGRINQYNDLLVNNFLLRVPLGIPDYFPSKGKKIKGIMDGISNEDIVLYWGGGIWEWSAPLILVDALEKIFSKRNNVRVIFGSLHHYDQTIVPIMKTANEFYKQLQERGWINKNCFFLDWIPYDERGSFLLEVDLGLSLFDHPLESRYAARARLMDYLWTGLPCIVSGDDELSKLLTSLELAIKVDPLKSNNLSEAITAIMDRPFDRFSWLEKHKDVIQFYKWSNIVKPILNYLSNPKLAPDSKLARESMEYTILLRKEWEDLRKEREELRAYQSELDREMQRMRDEMSALRNRKVVKVADKYGEVRDKLLQLLRGKK
jgi:hypothetical protein